MIKEMKKREGCLFIQNALAGLLLVVGMLLWMSPKACMTAEAEGTVIDSVEATVSQPVGWGKVADVIATPGNDTYKVSVLYRQEWHENYKCFVSMSPGE